MLENISGRFKNSLSAIKKEQKKLNTSARDQADFRLGTAIRKGFSKISESESGIVEEVDLEERKYLKKGNITGQKMT
ncbi:MAG: hypothetical protein OHK0017_13640 [Patescibacteria group bacterium]